MLIDCDYCCSTCPTINLWRVPPLTCPTKPYQALCRETPLKILQLTGEVAIPLFGCGWRGGVDGGDAHLEALGVEIGRHVELCVPLGEVEGPPDWTLVRVEDTWSNGEKIGVNN